jgi:hypothetical protein
MSLTIVLRIAAVISLLFAAGHTYGGRSSWSPIGETDTLRAMREFHMVISGVSRTYHDFYVGFSYSLSVFMLLQAVFLWLLADLGKTHPGPGSTVRCRSLRGLNHRCHDHVEIHFPHSCCDIARANRLVGSCLLLRI